MKLICSALLLSISMTSPALAQQKPDDRAGQPPLATTATDMTDGEIRKIDKEAGKVTLKHAEIKALDMPAMTMVFNVKDKAMLDTVKTGDKVKFKAINEGGRFTLTEMQVVR